MYVFISTYPIFQFLVTLQWNIEQELNKKRKDYPHIEQYKKKKFSHTEQHIIKKIKKIKKNYSFLKTKFCDIHSIFLISYLEEIRHNHSHGAEESFQVIWQFCAARVSRIPISEKKMKEKKE